MQISKTQYTERKQLGPLKKAILAVGQGQAIDFLKILDIRVTKGTI